LTVGKHFGKIIVDSRLGGSVEYYLTPPKDIDMRLPDGITSCVGFISHDQPTIQYGGTGFVVGTQGQHGNAFLHLVTAAHVAEKVEGSWLFGMNLKSGGKFLLKSGDAVDWWYHPTEKANVDVAVTIFASEQIEEYDLNWIPETMFATDERIAESNIGIGDEISVVGLFTRFSGKNRHWPIARTGNIAMMPDEPIPLKDYGPMEAYLAEGRSIGGLSGSPVFVRETVNSPSVNAKREPYPFFGQGGLFFLGLMHGHWEVPLGFKSIEQTEAVNMGISIVVPAKKVLEVIYHPELVEMRKKADEQFAADKAPVADDALGKKNFTKDDFNAALKKVSRKIKSAKSERP
jgi:hypothetical protein